MSRFDTLTYTKDAESVGIKREHAEFQAKVLASLINEDLVTNASLNNQLKELEYRMIFKLTTIMVACIGILGFILKN